jgi:hypothetical protein
MPERLDRVQIALETGNAEIAWAARGVLFELLGGVDGGTAIVDAFRNVGATRPVELTMEQKIIVLRRLERARGSPSAYDASLDPLLDGLRRERDAGLLRTPPVEEDGIDL